jgi:hypothetical protein
MAFCKYLGVFNLFFIDDFNVFNDLKMHLAKLRLCFDKCHEFDINLNLKKCMFLVYSRVILGYVVSKARKLPDPKKILVIMNMPALKTPKTYKFSMGWPSSIDVLSRTLPSSWPPSRNSYTKQRCLCGLLNVDKHGRP